METLPIEDSDWLERHQGQAGIAWQTLPRQLVTIYGIIGSDNGLACAKIDN